MFLRRKMKANLFHLRKGAKCYFFIILFGCRTQNPFKLWVCWVKFEPVKNYDPSRLRYVWRTFISCWHDDTKHPDRKNDHRRQKKSPQRTFRPSWLKFERYEWENQGRYSTAESNAASYSHTAPCALWNPRHQPFSVRIHAVWVMPMQCPM